MVPAGALALPTSVRALFTGYVAPVTGLVIETDGGVVALGRALMRRS